jgi:hypothetical protein
MRGHDRRARATPHDHMRALLPDLHTTQSDQLPKQLRSPHSDTLSDHRLSVYRLDTCPRGSVLREVWRLLMGDVRGELAKELGVPQEFAGAEVGSDGVPFAAGAQLARQAEGWAVRGQPRVRPDGGGLLEMVTSGSQVALAERDDPEARVRPVFAVGVGADGPEKSLRSLPVETGGLSLGPDLVGCPRPLETNAVDRALVLDVWRRSSSSSLSIRRSLSSPTCTCCCSPACTRVRPA